MDERKNRSNYQKHGVRFEAAKYVFDDPACVMVQDREVDGEERWQKVEMVDGLLFAADSAYDLR